MSDIQEEQKRLYKKAEENDIKLLQEEIKEILDELLFTTTLPNVSVKLSEEKLYQLKDYITNLQEELEELKIKYQILAHDDAWEIAEYKLRNEKAIEYIKRHIQPDSFEGYLDSYEIKKTLNILQGEEK